MEIIKKIELSRNTLKEILSDEFNTDTLEVLSTTELDVLYRINEPNSIYSILSNCPGCCFTLEHKVIKGHNLHIVYYNFPNISDIKRKFDFVTFSKGACFGQQKIDSFLYVFR